MPWPRHRFSPAEERVDEIREHEQERSPARMRRRRTSDPAQDPDQREGESEARGRDRECGEVEHQRGSSAAEDVLDRRREGGHRPCGRRGGCRRSVTSSLTSRSPRALDRPVACRPSRSARVGELGSYGRSGDAVRAATRPGQPEPGPRSSRTTPSSDFASCLRLSHASTVDPRRSRRTSRVRRATSRLSQRLTSRVRRAGSPLPAR